MNPWYWLIGLTVVGGLVLKKSADDAEADAAAAAAKKAKADADAKKKAEEDARIQAEADAKAKAAEKAAEEEKKKLEEDKKTGTDLDSLKKAAIFFANQLSSTPFKFQTVSPLLNDKPIGVSIILLINNGKAEKKDYFFWLSVLNSEYQGRVKSLGETTTTTLIKKTIQSLYDYGMKLFGLK